MNGGQRSNASLPRLGTSWLLAPASSLRPQASDMMMSDSARGTWAHGWAGSRGRPVT